MNKFQAFLLLKELNAPQHLIRHISLVGEAGEQLCHALANINCDFDRNFVEVGIVLHDVGKINYPVEMFQKGCLHELEGQQILLERGIDPQLARVCLSHGQWQTVDCSFEELMIALADKLWKGKREQELEAKIIQGVVTRTGRTYWDIFLLLDLCFEAISDLGAERLTRSMVG